MQINVITQSSGKGDRTSANVDLKYLYLIKRLGLLFMNLNMQKYKNKTQFELLQVCSIFVSY